MQVMSVDNCSFGTRNTFLRQAKQASNKSDKARFLSYHYEAKARCHYMKYLDALGQLAEEPATIGIESCFKLSKIYFKMAYDKLASINCVAKSYQACPERF